MKLSERIARLIDVKSIVTVMMIAVLCYTTVKGMETGELFNSSVMLVLGFFFGKNVNVPNSAENAKENIGDIKENGVVNTNGENDTGE